jgi:hypothetical protein
MGRRHRDLTIESFVSGPGDATVDSTSWADTFGEGTSAGIPGVNGSFAKFTTLGPAGNITGTPQGTGMRVVGSSPADYSSPAAGNFSSSPAPVPRSSTEEYLEPLDSEDTTPMPAHLKSPATSPSTRNSHGRKARPGSLYDEIRKHREQLASQGMIPQAYELPISPTTESAQEGRHLDTQLRPLSLVSLQHAPQKKPATVFRYSPHLNRPSVFFPTEPVPILPNEKIIYDKERKRHVRNDSVTIVMEQDQERKLSWLFFGICCLFPPLLLIFGFGGFDGAIMACSHGQVSKAGRTQKIAARWVGGAFGFCIIAGLIVALVIVTLSK